jgi:hypothetical protein
MSDGETIEEAIVNGREALRDCRGIQGIGPHDTKTQHQGRSMAPSAALDPVLTKQAENEGVSINSLVTAIIAEAFGAKRARQ